MKILSARHLWYWLRPTRWPEAARRIRDARRGRSWCRARAVTTAVALKALGSDDPTAYVADRFPDVFEEARGRAAACPFRLGGAGNLDLLHGTCVATKAARVVETGVAYGWSTLAILLAVKERPGAQVFSTDLPYLHLGMDNEPWVGVCVPDDVRGPWTLLRGADREVLPEAVSRARPIDVAHYDSDKSPEGRAWAYRLLWDALAPGGVLLSDDVDDNLAFRDFAEAKGVTPTVVEHDGKYQGVMVKPRDPGTSRTS